ncbi:hypothetical protein D3C81_1267230 [compost metagenome]
MQVGGYRMLATIKKIFVKCAVANGFSETLVSTRLPGMWRCRTRPPDRESIPK